MANRHEHEELRLLYDVSVKDIEFFKKQQWLVTYYGVLVYGTLVALAKISSPGKWTLCAGAISAWLLCAVLLAALEHSIGVRRDRLAAIRGKFSRAFNRAWEAGKKEKEYYIVLSCMLFALTVGAVLTVIGILNTSCAT